MRPFCAEWKLAYALLVSFVVAVVVADVSFVAVSAQNRAEHDIERWLRKNDH